MDFLWWAEPLFYTGVVTIILAILIGSMFDWNDVSTAIAIVLTIPFIVGSAAMVLWFLANIFVWIWNPYFG